MSEKKFLVEYFSNLKKLIDSEKYVDDIIRVKKILLDIEKLGFKKSQLCFQLICHFN